MTIRNSFILLVFGFFTVFWSCKNEPITPSSMSDNKNDSTIVKTLVLDSCSADSVYFFNDVVPILVDNCASAGCHIALTLATYNDIINIGDVVPGDTLNSYLYKVLVTTNTSIRMPRSPRPPLQDSLINVIGKWILQGAKNNACNSCNEQEYEFHDHVLPIIMKNCQSCHRTGNASGGVLLNHYFQIKQQAESGKLLGSFKHQQGFKAMPPQGKMPDCQIKVIENWINKGMLYD